MNAHRVAIFSCVACVTAVLTAACGGSGGSGTSDTPPTAAIVVPSAAAARVAPGGALSFEGTCPGETAATVHAWSFPGGSPPASDLRVAGAVTFAEAGTAEVTYRCTDGGLTLGEASRTVTIAAPGASQLELDVQYLGGADAYRGDVEWAVARAREVVTGPVAGMRLQEPASPGCGGVDISITPGRLLLLVSVEAIDGAGGVVARSGPCYVRKSDGLPVVGIIRLDALDLVSLQYGAALRATLLHELLHVLGFGTLWGPRLQNGFDLVSGAAGSDPVFTGAQARAAFRDFDGGPSYVGTPVPVENLGVAGSARMHWRAGAFGSELMTASFEGEAPPLSRTTVESLADLGWLVNAEAADPFRLPGASPAARLTGEGPAVDLEDDALPFSPQVR